LDAWFLLGSITANNEQRAIWNSSLHFFAQLPAIRVKATSLICAKNTVALARVAYRRTPTKISKGRVHVRQSKT
jgi:hypothetical protein